MSSLAASRAGSFTVLLIILLVGAALRVPGIFWGEGDLISGVMSHFHPDEYTHVNIAKQFLGRRDDNEDYVKGFGFQISLIAGLMESSGKRVSSNDLYRIGRWLSLFYGVSTIVLVFFLARFARPDHPVLASMAATIMALSSLAITQSHYAVADAGGVFYTWLSILFSLLAYRHDRVLYWILATAAAAIAVACKVMIVACAPVAVALLIRKRVRYEPWLLLSVFVLAFFLAGGVSMDGGSLLSAWDKINEDSIAVIPDHTPWESLTTVLISLPPAFSLPVILLSLRGTVLSYRDDTEKNDPKWLWIPLSAMLTHLGLLMMIDDVFERHLLLFAPALSLLASYAWLEVVSSSRRAILWSTPLVAYLLYFAIDSQLSFWFDNRILAREWVRTHIAHKSRIWIGPYAKLKLSRKRYDRNRFDRKTRPPDRVEEIDLLILHEAHTYRYQRSRLSPWSTPSLENVYHRDRFMLKYAASLYGEHPAFRPIIRFPVAGNRSPERLFYKRFWGHFQSFTGDMVLYVPTSR